MKFGGYTEQYWNSVANRKDAKNICFCFSLDLFKIYNFDDNNQSCIYCNSNYGPWFCGYNEQCFIRIYNNNGNNGYLVGDTLYQTKYNSFGKIDYDYEINNGQKDFSVVELEVFQILFDN